VQSSSQNHHHQQTNNHFLQAGCPSCRPTNSVKALKEKYHTPWTCLPQVHLGVFQLCLTTNSSWLPRGRVAMPLISPLMPVPQGYLPMPKRNLVWQHIWHVMGAIVASKGVSHAPISRERGPSVFCLNGLT